MLSTSPRRVAVVVHPTRPVDEASRALGRWAGRHGIDVVQLEVRRLRTEKPAMLPIPRTLSLDHLRESLAALFDTLN